MKHKQNICFISIRFSYCSTVFASIHERTAPPQYLCSWPLPQSSPAAPGSCPPCRLSCRSSAAEPRWHRSSWRTPQTWPGTARRSAPGITETLGSPSQESGDSLRARTCGGEIGGKRSKEKGVRDKPRSQTSKQLPNMRFKDLQQSKSASHIFVSHIS